MEEMIKVSVAKALKIKARLAGELSKMRSKLHAHNVYIKGNSPRYESSLLVEEKILSGRIARVKAAINVANAGISLQLSMLAEAKGRIAYLGNMLSMCEIGTTVNRYTEKEETKLAVIEPNDLEAEIATEQKNVEMFQDEIDKFNAMTEIEIPAN